MDFINSVNTFLFFFKGNHNNLYKNRKKSTLIFFSVFVRVRGGIKNIYLKIKKKQRPITKGWGLSRFIFFYDVFYFLLNFCLV
jgi:hypothetical protein